MKVISIVINIFFFNNRINTLISFFVAYTHFLTLGSNLPQFWSRIYTIAMHPNILNCIFEYNLEVGKDILNMFNAVLNCNIPVGIYLKSNQPNPPMPWNPTNQVSTRLGWVGLGWSLGVEPNSQMII